MPNRIIRESILSSDKVDQLDPPAEVFYRRLLSKVDDYGRFDARPAVLRAYLFPLRLDRVREADISRWMAACQKAGLIVLYVHNLKPYLECSNTEWQKRSPSRFPEPLQTSANICAQPLAKDSLVVDVGVVVVAEEQDAPPAATPPPEVANTAKGTRLPTDWTLPLAWQEWARAERTDLDPVKQGEKFRDHWQSLPGAKARKTDWFKTWCNWIRNERQGTSQPQAPSAARTGKPAGPSETKLEAAIQWARHQHHVGVIDVAERDRLIAVATTKHRGNE